MEQTYTIGQFLQSSIDVLGYNLLDTSSALPEIISLIFILTIFYIIWKSLKK